MVDDLREIITLKPTDDCKTRVRNITAWLANCPENMRETMLASILRKYAEIDGKPMSGNRSASFTTKAR